jgi:hypothetical protein
MRYIVNACIIDLPLFYRFRGKVSYIVGTIYWFLFPPISCCMLIEILLM